MWAIVFGKDPCFPPDYATEDFVNRSVQKKGEGGEEEVAQAARRLFAFCFVSEGHLKFKGSPLIVDDFLLNLHDQGGVKKTHWGS